MKQKRYREGAKDIAFQREPHLFAQLSPAESRRARAIAREAALAVLG